MAIWDRPRRTLMLARDRGGHQAPALRRAKRPRGIRERDQVAARRRRGEPRAGSRAPSITTSRFSIRRASRRSSRASESCRPGTTCAGKTDASTSGGTGRLPPRRRSAEAKPRRRTPCGTCSPEPFGRTWSATCRSAPFSPGGVDSSAVVGLMAHASSRPVQDVLDRVRRAGVRRAGACADGRASFRDGSSRVRRPARRAGDSRSARRALRRAVRRFIGDSDLVRLRDGETARHRRPFRRRRRRVVRRIRPLPAASRGSPGSIACRCPACAPPPALSGRCCRMASGARTSCVMQVEATRAATSTRSRCSRPTSARRSTRPTFERGSPSMPKRRSSVVSSGSEPCRSAAA